MTQETNQPTEQPTNPPLTLAAAQDAINQDRQARSDACSRLIAQALAEYGCEVRCPIQVIDGRLSASPIIVAL